MIWKTHPVYLDYAVTEDGQVKRERGGKGSRQGKVLAQRTGTTGYVCVQIGQRQKKVHVLVLETFVCLRPSGMHALHKDDDKNNNNLHNLRWGTRSDNYADRVRNGGGNHGSRNGQYKFTPELQLTTIRHRKTGMSHRAIAAIVGVSSTTICKFLQRMH